MSSGWRCCFSCDAEVAESTRQSNKKCKAGSSLSSRLSFSMNAITADSARGGVSAVLGRGLTGVTTQQQQAPSGGDQRMGSSQGSRSSTPRSAIGQIRKRFLSAYTTLLMSLGLCHEDLRVEMQFQTYFYNSQRIIAIAFCVCAFVFCGGGTALWIGTIDTYFVAWDFFAVVVWGLCGVMFVWLHLKHSATLDAIDKISLDADGYYSFNVPKNCRARATPPFVPLQRGGGGGVAKASASGRADTLGTTRGPNNKPSVWMTLDQLQLDLQWNSMWHERFLLLANCMSIWFCVGLNGAQGSCDYVEESRRILDCREAINTEGLLIVFTSASVFLTPTRLSVSWVLYPVWMVSCVGVLRIAVPSIVPTYFATQVFLMVFEIVVALGTLYIRELQRRTDFEHFRKRQDRVVQVSMTRAETERMLTVQLPSEVTRALLLQRGGPTTQSLFPWVITEAAVVCCMEVCGVSSGGWISQRSPIEVAELLRRVFSAFDDVRDLFSKGGELPPHTSRRRAISKYHCIGDRYVVVRDIQDVYAHMKWADDMDASREHEGDGITGGTVQKKSAFRKEMPCYSTLVLVDSDHAPTGAYVLDDAMMLSYALHSAVVATGVLRTFMEEADGDQHAPSPSPVISPPMGDGSATERMARQFERKKRWRQASVYVRCGLGVGRAVGLFCGCPKSVTIYGPAFDDAVGALTAPSASGSRPKLLRGDTQMSALAESPLVGPPQPEAYVAGGDCSSSHSFAGRAGMAGLHSVATARSPLVRTAAAMGGPALSQQPHLWSGLGLAEEDREEYSICQELARQRGRCDRPIVLGADVRVSDAWRRTSTSLFPNITKEPRSSSSADRREHEKCDAAAVVPVVNVLRALATSKGEGAITTGVHSLLHAVPPLPSPRDTNPPHGCSALPDAFVVEARDNISHDAIHVVPDWTDDVHRPPVTHRSDEVDGREVMLSCPDFSTSTDGLRGKTAIDGIQRSAPQPRPLFVVKDGEEPTTLQEAVAPSQTPSTAAKTFMTMLEGSRESVLFSTSIKPSAFLLGSFADEKTEAAFQTYSSHSATSRDVVWAACASCISLCCLFATMTYADLWELTPAEYRGPSTPLLIAIGMACCAVTIIVAVLAPAPWFVGALSSHISPTGYRGAYAALTIDTNRATRPTTPRRRLPTSDAASFTAAVWASPSWLDAPLEALDGSSARHVVYLVLWTIPVVCYASITFLVPQEGNIVGNSQLVWLIVLLNWGLIRPWWLRPIVAFGIDFCLCAAFFLRTYSRLHTTPVARSTALYMAAALILYSAIVRSVLGESRRSAFATELEALQLKRILQADHERLNKVVELVATEGIASRMIEHSRRRLRDQPQTLLGVPMSGMYGIDDLMAFQRVPTVKKVPCAANPFLPRKVAQDGGKWREREGAEPLSSIYHLVVGGATLDNVVVPTTTHEAAAHPIRSTMWSTSVWEVPFALIRLDPALSNDGAPFIVPITPDMDAAGPPPPSSAFFGGEGGVEVQQAMVVGSPPPTEKRGDDCTIVTNDDGACPPSASTRLLRRRSTRLPPQMRSNWPKDAALTAENAPGDHVQRVSDEKGDGGDVPRASSSTLRPDTLVAAAHRVLTDVAENWPQPPYMRLELYKASRFEFRVCVASVPGPRGSSADRKDADEERCFELLKFAAVVDQRLQALLPKKVSARTRKNSIGSDSPFPSRAATYRMMLHVGPLIGGVLGHGSVSYDYYGPAICEACAVLETAEALGAGVPPVLTSPRFAQYCRSVAYCDPVTWRREVDDLLSIGKNDAAKRPLYRMDDVPRLRPSVADGAFLGESGCIGSSWDEKRSSSCATEMVPLNVFAGEEPGAVVTARFSADDRRRRYAHSPLTCGVIASVSDPEVKAHPSMERPVKVPLASLLALSSVYHYKAMIGPHQADLLAEFLAKVNAVVEPSAGVVGGRVEDHQTGREISARRAIHDTVATRSAMFSESTCRWWLAGQRNPVDVMFVKFV